jgi:hypothetical protein
MKSKIVIAILTLAVLNGCGGKNFVQPDGTKVFGDHDLADGGYKADRLELTDGTKEYEVTVKDGTQTIGRLEFPNGGIQYNAVRHPDGSWNIAREILSDGTEKLNIVKPAKVVAPAAEEQAATKVRNIQGDLIELTPKEAAKRCGRPGGDVKKHQFSSGHKMTTRIFIYENAPNGPAGLLWLSMSDDHDGIFTGVQVIRNGVVAEEINTPTLHTGKYNPDWADGILTALPCLEKAE